jgi:SAM-dependent methyltransferase
MVIPKSVLHRSGLGSLPDLQTEEFKEMFNLLEAEQASFAEAFNGTRNPQYRWPHKPLHTWSRVWEYPYVYGHFREWRSRFDDSSSPVVVDVGSGVTFFPFTIGRLRCNVVCVDVDPVCVQDLNRVISETPGAANRMIGVCADSASIPLDDHQADAVYCISVLEHIPRFEPTLEEIARILKPGGVFFLTVDVLLRGEGAISKQRYDDLVFCLALHFDRMFEETIVHPKDILHSHNGRFPLPGPPPWSRLWRIVKERIVKPLAGMEPGSAFPPLLAVRGFALRKRGL